MPADPRRATGASAVDGPGRPLRTAPGPRTTVAALGVVLVAAAWLAWPLLSSTTAPTAADQAAEVPWVLAALVCLSVLLGVVAWADARRDPRVPQALALLGIANTLARPLLGAGSSGIEPVYVLPLVAGAYAGPAAGWLVGFWSCLASSAYLGVVQAPIATQAAAWGIAGALGGLLRPLPRRVAAGLAPFLGALAALGVGLAYNLPGWAAAEPVDATSFQPGLGVVEATGRLVAYTARSSLAVDLVRAAVTAAGLLLAAPLLAWLGRGFGTAGRSSAPRPPAPAEPLTPLRDETAWRTRTAYFHDLFRTAPPKEKPRE